MSLYPITLGIGRRPGAGGAVPLDRPLPRPQVEKILARDSFTCRCCDFTSHKYQRVIEVEAGLGQHASEGSSSFLTVCPFCELCFNLDRAGFMGAGALIWLPEISQADLHHLMRAVYIARSHTDGPLAGAADQIFDTLISRKTEAKKRIGTDDPLMLATVFKENLVPSEYVARATKLEGVRFLPFDRYLVRARGGDVDVFAQMVAYWQSNEGPFGKFQPEAWADLIDAVAAAA